MPKNRGAEFIELIAELDHDTCVEGTPDCPRCELRKICPTAQIRPEHAHPGTSATSKNARSKEQKPAPAPAPSATAPSVKPVKDGAPAPASHTAPNDTPAPAKSPRGKSGGK